MVAKESPARDLAVVACWRGALFGVAVTGFGISSPWDCPVAAATGVAEASSQREPVGGHGPHRPVDNLCVSDVAGRCDGLATNEPTVREPDDASRHAVTLLRENGSRPQCVTNVN